MKQIIRLQFLTVKKLLVTIKIIFALNNFAICLFQELKLNEAIQAYKRVIEINPKFAEAYRNLGILYNYVGDYEKSEMNYEKSLKLEPEHDFSNFIFSETIISK